MRKIKAFAFLVSIGIFYNLQAQTLSIGPAVSFGHSFITGDNVENQYHPSWAAGLSLTHSNEEHLGFGIDLLYSMEGSTADYTIGGVSVKNEIDLSYVRVPLRIIYFMGEFGDQVRPKIFAGPTLGFLTAAETETLDVKDQYNGFDFGLHVGAGANFQIAERAWLNTDITYMHGLTDITNNDIVDDINKNGNIRLNLGVLFGL